MRDDAIAPRSPLNRLDPRMRMACALGLAACLSLPRGLAAAALGLALGGALLLVCRPSWRPLRQRLAAVNAFLLFLWAVTPLTVPGPPLAQWGPLAVSGDGVRLAFLVSLKANAIACVFLALVAPMSAGDAGHALRALRCPDRLVALFLFTARYAHVIAGEWRALHVAACLRGFSPRTDRHTYRTLASLLGLLLVRSHERARRAWEAMLLRGFDGKFRSVTALRLAPADMALALAALVGAALVLAVEYGGGQHVSW